MDVAVVVSTVGRPADLLRLLQSLVEQTLPPKQVVVVDQSESHETGDLVREFLSLLPIERATSERGVSRGRNLGLALADRELAVMFPDDDVWFEPGTIQAAVSALRNADAVAGRLLQESGGYARLRFDAVEPFDLDRRSVWTHAIEATMAISPAFRDAVGGFNESIGTGAATPWQSGEGTELLLRGMGRGLVVRHDPAVRVFESDDSLTADERRRKARHYARGTGRVHRMHISPSGAATPLPPAARALRAVMSRNGQEARLQAAIALGRLEGLAGVTLGRVR